MVTYSVCDIGIRSIAVLAPTQLTTATSLTEPTATASTANVVEGIDNHLAQSSKESDNANTSPLRMPHSNLSVANTFGPTIDH
jgi:hypothetical protein